MTCANNCQLWARIFDPKLPLTSHHPNCSHVNDSLIDVWRVHIPGESGGCVFDKEDDARAMVENEGEDNDAPLEITAEKMHREIFDKLGEFDGF